MRLRRFFAEGAEGDSLLLVDEAHNLPDRARSIYSADFNTAYLSDFGTYIPSLGDKIKENAEELIKQLKKLRSYCSDNLYRNDDGSEV